MTDTKAMIDSLAKVVAKDWFRRQCANVHEAMYLYHKPHEMGLWVGAEPLNEDWVLSDPGRVSPFWDIDKAASWIREKAYRLPILRPEDV
jgi:hypothetical protein